MGTVPGSTERKELLKLADRDAVTCDDFACVIAEAASQSDPNASKVLGRFYAVVSEFKDGLISWLLDTGASDHLVSKKALGGMKKRIRTAAQPLTLQTANGNIPVSDCIDLQLDSLDAAISAYVLKNSEDSALSPGRLVVDHGFDFWWHSECENHCDINLAKTR